MGDWDDMLADVNELCRDTFPTTATYTPKAGGGPYSITGVFTENARHLGPEPGVSDTEVQFAVIDADMQAVGVTSHMGDTLALKSRSWKVVDMRPDGSGRTVLVLEVIG